MVADAQRAVQPHGARAVFVTGSLTGVPVPCVSVTAQRLFNTGYELRDIDRHDLAVLDELTAAAIDVDRCGL